MSATPTTLPPLAVTCGDPAGIGPEIALRACAALRGTVPFFLVGDPAHLPPDSDWRVISDPAEAGDCPPGVLPVLAHAFPAPACPGTPDPLNAPAVVDVIARAVVLVQSGAAGALVTCPVSKKVLKEGAGFAFPGHTEYLAHLGGGADVAMMLACDGLRVVPATIHIALQDVVHALTSETLERAIRITYTALRMDFALSAPRIAVAGLNPHAGEGGTMGLQEVQIIAPLLARLRSEGMDLAGPLPADTMFHPAARAGYDAAICMYHDQALIPIKTIDFSGGVNVTLGLPFVRTSPDHGTAFDIAGQGRADPSSLIAALRMAADLAARRMGR